MKLKLLLLGIIVHSLLFSQENNWGRLDSLLKTGYDSYKEGRIDDARIIFDNIISIDSGYYKAYNGKAVICLFDENYEDGLFEINKALALKPDYEDGILTRGELYLSKLDFRNAIKDFNKVLKINPSNGQAKGDLGVIDFYKGDLYYANRKLNKSVRLDPENARSYYNARNYYNLGTVELNQNIYKKAVENFDKAIALKPPYGLNMCYTNRGTAKYYLGDLDGALNDYKKSYALKPDNPTLLANMGMIYFNKNKFQTAIEYFSEAIEIDPKKESAYFNRGTAYFKLGQYERALRDFKISCKLGSLFACKKIKKTEKKLRKASAKN